MGGADETSTRTSNKEERVALKKKKRRSRSSSGPRSSSHDTVSLTLDGPKKDRSKTERKASDDSEIGRRTSEHDSPKEAHVRRIRSQSFDSVTDSSKATPEEESGGNGLANTASKAKWRPEDFAPKHISTLREESEKPRFLGKSLKLEDVPKEKPLSGRYPAFHS